MRTFIYPGSFDPVTNGHLDIIERASKICDRLIVGVLVSHNKKPLFTMDERVDMLGRAIRSCNCNNVEVEDFSGLLVDFVKKKNADVIIKGLRAVSDFEYELQMALLNKNQSPEIETLFMMSSINYSFLSSSMVKEIARYDGNIKGLVPECIKEDIISKFTGRGISDS
ncbi:phosphopantetheine adenylyltransferase [Ruminiclostridium sufflavum DSM 19573]|uniref:Phosphopantetheine adenylyltransferase n=1 Tax=Ruminiclostridium sufflavum DSM 19573 TaxID=1121337 RepID=A0A318XJY5_9FIRM|nr:pantetheine-phosphate adenylyltransferase [Ruminiclostridium sufflavum]PYG86846.1 phosphopantetheine adenylyltransferase [Ruminiclostridium sufflavum DSM 19573]